MGFKEFVLPTKPVIQGNTYKVTDFGAVCDGVQNDSKAVSKAIEACRDGGTVIFPKGRYLVGPIKLKSNIEIHFEDGCEIFFSREKSDYLPVVYTSFEGIRCYNYSPLIYGNGVSNVAVTGNARLDGGGDSWWAMKEIDKGVNSLYTAGAKGTPVSERVYGTEDFGLRPCFIQLVNSENVYLDGLFLTNSPFWNVHPVWCKNVCIKNVTIDNPRMSPNTDGINIDACKNVLVEYCQVVSGGDDIFCLKSGRGREGREVGIPCENVVIRHCSAGDVNGGGIVIGSEMSGGVKNILAHDCAFLNVASGVRIKTKRGRGGYVTDIECRNFKLESVERVINVCMRYAYDDAFSDSGDGQVPEIGNMTFENFACKKAKYGILLEGLSDAFIKNITVNKLYVENAEIGVSTEFVSGFSCNDIRA